jgi:chromate transport protein ChrA
MRVATASGVRVRQQTGLRTVGLAVVLVAIALLALAAVLSAVSPLRLDPVIFGVSVVIGVALTLAMIRTGGSRSQPSPISLDKPTGNY